MIIYIYISIEDKSFLSLKNKNKVF